MRARNALLSLGAGILLALLAACSSGGDDAPPPPVTVTLNGTAATGAALAGGTLRVVDRAGTARTLAAPIGADGRYTIDVTGLLPPLLVVAEGRIGESTGQLMAVEPTGSASGTITVNATPMTTAIAALVAPGNNLGALSQPATLAALTAAQVSQAVTAVNTSLAPLYAAAGIASASGFNPMTTPFTVGQPGQDRLLDAVKVELHAQGVTFTNATAPIDGSTGQPQANTVITLTAANLASPPTIAAGSGAIAVDFLATMRQGFNDCFALAAAARAGSAACTGLFDAGYLMHGYTAAQRWLGNDALMTNAQFAVPELLYTFPDPSDGAPMPVLRFLWTRSDGEFGTRVEVAKNYGTTAAPAWRLRGNLRDIEIYVEPRLARILERSATVGASRYELGIRAVINILGPRGSEIARARVLGPGFPAAGLMLVRGITCGTGGALVIQNDTGTIVNWTQNTANNYRIAYADVDAARPYTWPGASRNFRDTPMSAAELAAIRPGSVYQWEIWFRDPVTKVIAASPVVYRSSLSSPLPAPSSGPSQPWHAVSDATLDALLVATAPAAAAATIRFSRAAGAEPVRSLYMFGSKPDPAYNPPTLTDTTHPLYGTSLQMLAFSSVLAPTATSADVSVAAESRGVDFDIGAPLPACASLQFPAPADAGAFREIALDSVLSNGVRKRSAYYLSK